MNMQYKQWLCQIKFENYRNGQTAIILSDQEDGMPIARATVCLMGEDIEDDEVCVKDYSENGGMYQALLDAGVIEPTERRIRATPQVIIPVAKLTPEALAAKEVS